MSAPADDYSLAEYIAKLKEMPPNAPCVDRDGFPINVTPRREIKRLRLLSQSSRIAHLPKRLPRGVVML